MTIQPKNQKQNQKTTTLTKREIEILKWISKGYTTKAVAKELDIRFETVKTHRKNILKKLKTINTANAIRIASERKLIK